MEKVYFGDEAISQLSECCKALPKNETHFLLCDSNTLQHAYPVLQKEVNLPESLELLEVEPGESSKSLEIVEQLAQVMIELGGSRKSTLFALGGGMITDLGGFLSAIFKRGIGFYSIPTSLLAMVDAAIGGKTGVNTNAVKNQLGLFLQNHAVFVYPAFLDSLPADELRAGKAEMLKHALLQGYDAWDALKKDFDNQPNPHDIFQSIELKQAVVNSDFLEQGERKKLNVGHTIGHAIESVYQPISHGDAVAWGMAVELCIASHYFESDFRINLGDELNFLFSHYPIKKIEISQFEGLLRLMKADKKNEGNSISFALAKDFGSVEVVALEKQAILNGLEFFNQFFGES